MDILRELPRLTFFRGRVGLFHILKALGIGEGDLVATQAFTCLAVPEGICATGARPLFVDTEEGGVTLCPIDLSRKINQKVKAVVVQHTFGIPSQMAEIQSILKPLGVPLIEDCCHTFASTYVNQVVGTFGIGSFYSFEWGKPLVAGVGGSAILNSDELFKKVEESWQKCTEPSWKRLLKIQIQYAAFQMLYRPSSFWQVRSAFQKLARAGAAEGNYNPTEGISDDFALRMAGPLVKRLRSETARAEKIVDQSKKVAQLYESGLAANRLRCPVIPSGGIPVYARYPLMTPDKERLLARAQESRVEVADWYKTPIHPLGRDDWAKIGYEAESCPRAESLSSEIVSLPLNMKVTERDVNKTLELLTEF